MLVRGGVRDSNGGKPLVIPLVPTYSCAEYVGAIMMEVKLELMKTINAERVRRGHEQVEFDS